MQLMMTIRYIVKPNNQNLLLELVTDLKNKRRVSNKTANKLPMYSEHLSPVLIFCEFI